MTDDDFEFDRFIKITEATKLLGYASYRSTNQLIEKGILLAYRLPHVSRKRVLLSDVLKLIEDAQEKTVYQQNGPGRPSKY